MNSDMSKSKEENIQLPSIQELQKSKNYVIHIILCLVFAGFLIFVKSVEMNRLEWIGFTIVFSVFCLFWLRLIFKETDKLSR
jgi:protein-S-isoprenylcysteine O-methyltransferase Ste14